MEVRDKLPKVSSTDNLTSRGTGPPSYAMSSNMQPHPPEDQGQITELACLTNGKGEHIPADYISKWKFTDNNKDRRLTELVYTLNLLKSQKPTELVTDAKKYERDFYLLTRGMYRSHNIHKHNRELVVTTLINNGAMHLLTTYWGAIIQEFEAQRSIITPKVNSNGELWSRCGELPHKRYIVESLQNCYSLMVVFWNGSDIKNHVNLKKMYDNLGRFFLENLERYLHPVADVPNHPHFKIVKSFLGTLHNLFNKYGECIDEMRALRGIEILSQYRNSGNVLIQVKSVLASAYLLQDQDKENQDNAVFELGEKDMKFMITALEDAMKSENYHSKTYGYNVEELITGINNIAAIDCNKGRLVDAGILPVYVRGMKALEPGIQKEAANGVWVLAFEEKNTKKIIEQPDLMNELRKLSKSENNDVQKAAEGALWKLEGEEQHRKKNVGATNGRSSNMAVQQQKHIMISYQWDVQPQVLKIRERLKQAGYNVWIDVEQMRKGGSTLEAMAKAVENASVVVPVLTDKYKNSPPCRQEASYANSLNKKLIPIRLQPKYRPDGWLAFLLAGAFHYDLYDHSEYESKIRSFLNALGSDATTSTVIERPLTGNTNNSAVVPTQPTVRAAQQPAVSKPVTQLQCANWSEQQVVDWIKRINLQKYVKCFSGVTGKLLVELTVIKATAPDSYYSIMRDENKMSMVDLLRFNTALNELA